MNSHNWEAEPCDFMNCK